MKISPMVDFAFKSVFGSEKNKSILIDFLNATIKSENVITDLILLDPFNLKDYAEDKLSILDVKAKLDDGSFVNVEVQLINQRDMKKRTLFYWSKLFSNQIKEGDNYMKLQKTIAINILNFEILDETQKFHSTFHLKEDSENFVFSDIMEIHMIEVPKIANSKSDINDKLLSWVLFFNNPQSESMEMITMKNPQIKKAMTALEFLEMDRRNRELYEARLKELRDKESQLEYAKEVGFEKGIKEGMEKGLEQGLEKGMEKGMEKGLEQGKEMEKLRLAVSLIKLGVSDEIIIKSTDISPDKLEEIKKKS